MCGIAGFFSLNKHFSEADLIAMTDSMQHRGPDANGFYVNQAKTLGLGHRRLSILDLSTFANQPMFSADDRYVIVFNGEVYNFKDIQKKHNIVTKTTSDTEVILALFQKLGVDCVNELNGMFAIAIYDKQEDELFLFRDRLGVKPIYYFFDGSNFAFGSELKAITKAPFVKQHITINHSAIASFLYLGYIPEPETIYNNIFKFPSGSFATLSQKGLSIKSYWKAEEKIVPNTQNDFATAKQELKNLLHSSIEYRMIADVPYGAFLSGGIDSSTVTAIAQEISPLPLKTFSIAFDDAKHNEAEFARAVSSHLKTDHHEFRVTEKEALSFVDRIASAYDEPFADSSSIPTMFVSKLAREHVTMTLSGDGGDELFHGYGMYTWAQRLNTPFVKALRGPIAAGLSLMGNRYKRGAQVFNYPTEQRIKSHIFSQEQYFFSENELPLILNKAFCSPITLNENFSSARKLSAKEEQALFDINCYLKDDLLVKVDRASMQFSLEARTPFLDYRLVEFALNLNENLKVKDGVQKYLLKEVLYDYVPRELFNRPKWGFSIPLNKWLQTDLKYLIDSHLSKEAVEQFGVLNYTHIASLKQRFFAGEDFLYQRLWLCVLLQIFLKNNS